MNKLTRNISFAIYAVLFLVPVIFTHWLKEIHFFHHNVLAILIGYYGLLSFIPIKVITKGYVLLFIGNSIPFIGGVIGYVLYKIYLFHCYDFETAILERPNECQYMLISEQFVYFAIYTCLIMLLIDIYFIVKRKLLSKRNV